MKYFVWIGVVLVFLQSLAFAGDNPISLNAEIFGLSYTATGDLHNSVSRVDYGLLAGVSYPLYKNFRIEGLVMLGVNADFQFFGGGLTYEFSTSQVTKTSESDTVEIEAYKKWRPYIGLDLGSNTVDTNIVVSRINAIIVETLLGFVLRAGVRYAIDPNWLVSGSLIMVYGTASDVSATSYGASLGLTLNLF